MLSRRHAAGRQRHAWVAWLAAGTATLSAACGVASDSQAPARAPALGAPPQSVRHAFDLPDRSAVAASVAALGPHVVVAWSASDGLGADVFAAASADSGRTFSSPKRVNQRPHTVDPADPPRVALAASGERVKAYVVWTSSLDGGREVRLASAESPGWMFDERPLVPVSASFRPAPGVAARASGTPFFIWRGGHERRGGATGAAASPGEADGAPSPRGAWLYAAPSDEAGSVTGDPIARDVCEDGEAAVTAGPSGEIHVAWRRVAGNDDADVAVARSAGASGFEPPVLLGAGPDGAPARASGRQTSATCGGGLTMSTDPTGLTHVVWRAAAGDGGREGALLLAWSRDGRAFTRPTRVDLAEGFDPQHPHLAVVGGSDIALVWDGRQGNRRRIWLRVTAGTCGRVADPFGPARIVSDEVPATRPVVAAAHEGLVLAWVEHRPAGPVVVVSRLVWADVETWSAGT